MTSDVLYPDMAAISGHVQQQLAEAQRYNVFLGRSLYCLLFALNSPSKSRFMPECDEVTEHIIIGGSRTLDSPEFQAAQDVQRLIRLVGDKPEFFAKSLSTAKVSPVSFAFLTFPAVFGYFTSVELHEKAGEFVVQLIRESNDAELLVSVCIAFMFSAFSFSECLWVSVGKLTNGEGTSRKAIEAALRSGINGCMRIVPPPVRSALMALIERHPELLAQVVCGGYLKQSFDLWVRYSWDGTFFRAVDEVREYVENIGQQGEALVLSSLFATQGPKIVKLPSYSRRCGMACEKLVVSGIDLTIMADVFGACFPEVEIYDAIGQAGRRKDGYVPYAIDYYSRDGGKEKAPPLFQIPNVVGIELPDSPAYERACEEEWAIDTEEFREYKRTRRILQMYENAVELEDTITRRGELQLAMDLKRTLLRLRNAAFEKYLVSVVKQSRSLKHTSLMSAMKSLLSDKCDGEQLTLSVFLVLLDAGYAPKFTIQQELLLSYQKVARAQIRRCWKEPAIANMKKKRKSLLALLNALPPLSLGGVFKFLTVMLRDIELMCTERSNGSQTEGMFALCAAMLACSGSGKILMVFMFYEKVMFRKLPFVKNLDQHTLQLWNSYFFSAMWSVIAVDPELFKVCTEFASKDPKVRKFKI